MGRTVLFDSITDADATAKGAIVVSGSHGGLYPAMLASRAGARAVILNDAGIGHNHAGVAGIEALSLVGMAGAAADTHSARIGSANDILRFGVISHVNAQALELGVVNGASVTEALIRMAKSPEPTGMLPKIAESRKEHRLEGTQSDILLVDSASLVTSDDAGRIIIAGSHGALIGGDPRRALKASARFACFNDAGIGRDKVGIGRLAALEHQGIAAVTVSHDTCVIGDAASALETGLISAANEQARAFGIHVNDPLRAAVMRVVAAG